MFAPVAAGGGYLVGRFRCVNRPFPAFSLRSAEPILAQTSLRAAEGLPSHSVAIRLRLATLAALGGKIKGTFEPCLFTSGAAAPSEERLSSGRPS